MYIDPKLCPSNVKYGHVVLSTRTLDFKNTK